MRLRARAPMATIVFVLTSAACIALLAKEPGSVHPHPVPKPPDVDTLEMLREMQKESEALKKRPKEDMVPIPPQYQGDDLWSGMLQVTQHDNPLIADDCRHSALQFAVDTIGGIEKAIEHAAPHQEEWRRILEGNRMISITKYLDHMSKCTEFCGPLITKLIECHLANIKTCSIDIVTFRTGWPRDGNFQFTPELSSEIESFAHRMRAENRAIMLEARASLLNNNESLVYNQALSRRRADAVTTVLLAAGFPPGDITVKSLCWEPPRLAIREYASAYKLQGAWAQLANHQLLDQSVVLVGYDKRWRR